MNRIHLNAECATAGMPSSARCGLHLLCLLLAVLILASPVFAADPTEDDYYPLVKFPIPEGIVLEAGGLQLLPDGKLAVSTRRGEIWMVENPLTQDPEKDLKFTRFAQGLHEVLGLAYRDGWLYATQRCELSRLKDTDGDGRADVYETVSDGWGINGDYHEYAFGSKFDKDGNIWVALCLTGSFGSNSLFRGWALRISADGKTVPTCSGLRSPGGIGMNHLGDMFMTDNQGPWNGTCNLKHLAPGSFQGHPAGNKWYDVTDAIGPRPKEPTSGSRIIAEAEKIPEYVPPAVLFPYGKMGQSASGVACDTTGGKFGPFVNQLFVGDQTHSTIMRVSLEKVKGRYQGACYPFRSGISSGTLSIEMTPSGAMFVGSTNRGWGSRGNKPFGLDRITWSGKTPFEILEMKAQPDGFELVFTEPLDSQAAAEVKSYAMTTWCYIFQAAYGSPEVDKTTPTITKAAVGPDNKSVRLYVNGLQPGHVHHLQLPGIRSAEGQKLLHGEAFYTLNYIP